MSTDAFKLAMSGLHTYFISNWVFMVDFCCRLFHILTVFRYLLLLSCLGQLYAALWELPSGKFIRNSHLATFWFSLFGLRIEAIRSSTTLFIDIVRIAKVSWIQFKRLDCEKWTSFVGPSLHESLLSKSENYSPNPWSLVDIFWWIRLQRIWFGVFGELPEAFCILYRNWAALRVFLVHTRGITLCIQNRCCWACEDDHRCGAIISITAITKTD